METRHLLRGLLVTEVIGVPAPTQQALQFSDSMFVGGLGHVASTGDRSNVEPMLCGPARVGPSFFLSIAVYVQKSTECFRSSMPSLLHLKEVAVATACAAVSVSEEAAAGRG